MIIDVIGIIFILFYFVRGYSKGIIVALCSMLALLLGIVIALTFSPSLAEWLVKNDICSFRTAQIGSYALLFIAVVIIVRVIANILQKTAKALMLGGINMLIGGIAYAFLGLVLWSAALWVITRLNIVSPRIIADSKTYPWFAGIAPWFMRTVAKLLPFASDAYNQFDHFLRTV